MTIYCEGCRSYAGIDSMYCSYMKFNQNSKCPCTLCIVKMVCLKACQDWKQFKKRSYELDKISHKKDTANAYR